MPGRARRLMPPVLLLAALLAGPPRPAGAETITVTHWGSAFYGAPYAVAMAKGFFRGHGVDITGILTSTGGGTSVRNTLAGGLPYGEVALAAAMEAVAAGQKLVIINGGVDSIGDILWIARPGAPLHSVQDLRGRRVGFTEPGSVTNMLILMALKANGMTAQDVKLVAAGGIGANLSAVLNNAIDAGMTGEPVWSENRDKVQPVFWARDVLPPAMMQTVGITTRAFAAAHPDILRAIIAARREGVAYIAAHPDESAAITAAAYNGDDKLYRDVFRSLLAVGYWSDGRLDYAGMDRMAEGLRIIGRQSGPVDWSRLVDASLLPGDLQQAGR